MGSFYAGRRARSYDTRYHTFTKRTLSEALAMVDLTALRRVKTQEGRPPRVLDVACGTGIFLSQLLGIFPDLEAYGIDASADMLSVARARLAGFPQVHLEQVEVDAGMTIHVSSASATFDLVTCTNALHSLPDPVGTLVGMRQLLAPGGHLVLSDIARPSPRLLGSLFEWGEQLVIGTPVQLSTLAEGQELARQAELRIACSKAFRIDWLLQGWALRAQDACSPEERSCLCS